MSILIVSIWMFFGIMTNFKNVISWILNLHFSVLIFKFFHFNVFKTILTYLIYVFFVSEYTKTSSIYVFANLSKYNCNVLLITFYIIVKTFINPNDMTKYSYIPYFVLNTVFHSFFYLILIKLNTSRIFKILKYRAFLNFVFISVINGNGYLFLTLTAFIFL